MQARSIAALLDDGNSIPFIARYRKEVTGLLKDGQLRAVRERLQELDALETRREKILKNLEVHNPTGNPNVRID